MIEIVHMSKIYPNQKGVFDIHFTVKKGEVFGFLGPNGAGKTTTIRQLLGLTNATEGSCFINGINTRTDAHLVHKHLGYLPGEIAFFDHLTGEAFLTFLEDYRQVDASLRKQELIEYFELDVKGKIKKMSKGMKQKLAIVACFMHDPEVIILDEPTSGLDPLMQRKFIELILKEKARNKTILMSTHMFEEVERTCDRAAIIKEGKIVALDHINHLKKQMKRRFYVNLASIKDEAALLSSPFIVMKQVELRYVVEVEDDYKGLFTLLASLDVSAFNEINQSLEQIFLAYYEKEAV